MKATILNDHEPKTYALIFDKGDEVVKELTAFAKEHRLAAAHFTAIGAFSQVTLGYFDRARKDYTNLLDARVWPTLELVLTESARVLARVSDRESGLALIDLDAARAA